MPPLKAKKPGRASVSLSQSRPGVYGEREIAVDLVQRGQGGSAEKRFADRLSFGVRHEVNRFAIARFGCGLETEEMQGQLHAGWLVGATEDIGIGRMGLREKAPLPSGGAPLNLSALASTPRLVRALRATACPRVMERPLSLFLGL